MIANLRCKCTYMIFPQYPRSPKAHLLTQSRLVQVLPSLRLLLLHMHGRWRQTQLGAVLISLCSLREACSNATERFCELQVFVRGE